MRWRPLDWTADPPGVSSARHLRAFQTLVLAHFSVQNWGWALRPVPSPYTFPTWGITAAAVFLTLLCVASLLGRGRWLCVLAWPVVAWEVAWLFPVTANHTFLGLVVLGLCSLLDPERPEEEALLLQSLRWLAVLVFFWAGAQKLLNGLYLRGEFLTWMVAQGIERWADVFGWMIPEAELARLQSIPRFMKGGGPYRVDSALFVLAANAVWIGEIAIAVGLLFRRTRQWAALAAIALVFVIQSAPREFLFAVLYTNLVLLSVRGEWNRRLLPVFVAFYVLVFAARLGAIPAGFLVKADGAL